MKSIKNKIEQERYISVRMHLFYFLFYSLTHPSPSHHPSILVAPANPRVAGRHSLQQCLWVFDCLLDMFIRSSISNIKLQLGLILSPKNYNLMTGLSLYKYRTQLGRRGFGVSALPFIEGQIVVFLYTMLMS
ncbi:unnamed protein product [Camellia sinensis]